MIFRTQKLEQLKKIESEIPNKLISNIAIKVINQVWPQSEKRTFCQTIQNIGVKWMNEFLVLIENWLAQSSKKYINKLSELKKQQTNSTTFSQIEEYLLNFSKYIKSMQYPFMSSLSNIYNLYLKFPSDQLIQIPVKTSSKPVATQQKQLKKRKSLSIDSFTSNLHTTKLRSSSKSRKISFFNNPMKVTTTNFYQTVSKDFKQKQNLNTTVKKVKKQISFIKSNHSTMNNFRQESNIRQNQNQTYESQNRNINTNTSTHILKQKLQERLSKTCSTPFFNKNLLEQSNENHQNYQKKSFSPRISCSPILQSPNQADIKIQKISLQEDLKKQIIQQISMKDKQNYDNLVKDIEAKFSNKFDLILEKIAQQKSTPQHSAHSMPSSINQLKQISLKEQNKNQKIVVHQKYLLKPQPAQNQVKNFYKKQINQHQFSQPSFSSQQKSYSIQQQNNQTQKQHISNQKTKNTKMNTSILQKDPSKIIKPKNKNTSILQNSKSKKELLTQTIKQEQKKIRKQENVKNHQNKIDSSSSIDSIDIIDSDHVINFNKNPIKMQSQQKESVGGGNPSTKPIQKKQDNFYMKRIKQQKSRMQISIKSFKAACDNLALPVNETFLIMFALSYKSFCQANSLSLQSAQTNKILFSKYSSQSELKSKLPQSQEKFLIDSLLKIQKMINLKCPADKKVKIQQFTQSCVSCIQNVFFQRPDLNLQSEPDILKKLRDIKSCMVGSKQNVP